MTKTRSGITIVGLGPGDPALRTLAAQRALDLADAIVLRTRIHPGLDDLAGDPRVTDCDDLYQSAATFEDLYAAIAARVLERAAVEPRVVFAVPGHPRFGEQSVRLLESLARAAGIPVVVADAVSFLDVVINSLAVDPVADGLQILDASDLAAALDAEPFGSGLLGINPLRPLLISQVFRPELAALVKLALARLYPDDVEVTVIRGAAIRDVEHIETVPLHALDRQPVDHLTSLLVSPLAPLAALRTPDSLLRIVARLRRPDGCPWDRAQTHQALRDSLLEEAYEAVDAIDGGDAAALAEELGDVLLLVAMHAQIAEEAGTFTIEDVCEEIGRKLIRRHPHVFSTVVAESPDAVIATWNSVKAAERATKGVTLEESSPLDRLPRAMPATRKAVELLGSGRVLHAPEDPADGDELLRSVRALIDRGIDPERALEVSLRGLQTAVAGSPDR
jgi:tetrapyrrole methylase family protein/MazG family protein